MDHTTRRLIDRVAAGKGQPVAISGYVGSDDEGDGRGLRIYPDMDANHYYVVDLKCPIEMVVIPDDPQDRVTVIVESASQIETVTRQRVPAATLAGRTARRRSHAPPVRGRDGVHSLLIALAKASKQPASVRWAAISRARLLAPRERGTDCSRRSGPSRRPRPPTRS